VQGKSTLSAKILTEKEKFRLGYSENPDFFKVENKRLRAHSNFVTTYFAFDDSNALIGPNR
jgi:hypothetical protein